VRNGFTSVLQIFCNNQQRNKCVALALQEIPPMTFTAARFTLAFLASSFVWRSSLTSMSRYRLRQGVVLGILFGFGFYLQTLGLLFTSVGNSAFITGALVVFTPFAYWLIERKRLSIHHIISVAVVFAGLLIFVRPTATLNIGDGLTLLSAAGWALYIVYVDVFTRSFPFRGHPSGRFCIPPCWHRLLQRAFRPITSAGLLPYVLR